MKFFHLSDLHIGKQLHNYNLREDQEHILSEVVSYVREIHPDAVVIAGDVYDKSVPSAESVTLFDQFLTELSQIRPHVPVLVIAGNHDSAKRLDYASRLLGSHRIYIAGSILDSAEGHIKKVTLKDEYGEVDFYLLPFLKPGYIRALCEGETPESYTEAVRVVMEREPIDFSRRNVLISHQFYTGNGETALTCDSELLSVGGIDNVDASVIKDFDYVALGHLHGAQRAGAEHIRYCGTLLKYSVSEADQKKSLHMVELGAKGEPVKITQLELHPLRDVKKMRGRLAELLDSAQGRKNDDYVSITLTDEVDPYKPKEQLEKVFSHILEIRMDNERTRKKLEFSDEAIKIGDPVEAFGDFFCEMQGRPLSEEEYGIMTKLYEQAKEDEDL